MVWDCQGKLNKRNYRNEAERKAFVCGYSDGYEHKRAMDINALEFPDAYSAGYWKGRGDATQGTKNESSN